MKFYIREWSEHTIVLMTENGHVLAYFKSIAEALEACSEWYDRNDKENRYEVKIQYRQNGFQKSSQYDTITALAS